MFDYVEYEADCPYCGEKLKDFQSKDGPCGLATLLPKDVREFYTSCDNKECGKWVEFKVHRTCIVDKIELMTKPEEEDSDE